MIDINHAAFGSTQDLLDPLAAEAPVSSEEKMAGRTDTLAGGPVLSASSSIYFTEPLKDALCKRATSLMLEANREKKIDITLIFMDCCNLLFFFIML